MAQKLGKIAVFVPVLFMKYVQYHIITRYFSFLRIIREA